MMPICMTHFPTPFTDEVLENVGGHEVYSFTDGFSGYHQIQIAKEDHHKTAFTMEWGSYQYIVMSFGFKNSRPSFLVWWSKHSRSFYINFWKHILMIGLFLAY
jgi:hypothetical protein